MIKAFQLIAPPLAVAVAYHPNIGKELIKDAYTTPQGIAIATVVYSVALSVIHACIQLGWSYYLENAKQKDLRQIQLNHGKAEQELEKLLHQVKENKRKLQDTDKDLADTVAQLEKRKNESADRVKQLKENRTKAIRDLFIELNTKSDLITPSNHDNIQSLQQKLIEENITLQEAKKMLKKTIQEKGGKNQDGPNSEKIKKMKQAVDDSEAKVKNLTSELTEKRNKQHLAQSEWNTKETKLAELKEERAKLELRVKVLTRKTPPDERAEKTQEETTIPDAEEQSRSLEEKLKAKQAQLQLRFQEVQNIIFDLMHLANQDALKVEKAELERQVNELFKFNANLFNESESFDKVTTKIPTINLNKEIQIVQGEISKVLKTLREAFYSYPLYFASKHREAFGPDGTKGEKQVVFKQIEDEIKKQRDIIERKTDKIQQLNEDEEADVKAEIDQAKKDLSDGVEMKDRADAFFNRLSTLIEQCTVAVKPFIHIKLEQNDSKDLKPPEKLLTSWQQAAGSDRKIIVAHLGSCELEYIRTIQQMGKKYQNLIAISEKLNLLSSNGTEEIISDLVSSINQYFFLLGDSSTVKSDCDKKILLFLHTAAQYLSAEKSLPVVKDVKTAREAYHQKQKLLWKLQAEETAKREEIKAIDQLIKNLEKEKEEIKLSQTKQEASSAMSNLEAEEKNKIALTAAWKTLDQNRKDLEKNTAELNQMVDTGFDQIEKEDQVYKKEMEANKDDTDAYTAKDSELGAKAKKLRDSISAGEAELRSRYNVFAVNGEETTFINTKDKGFAIMNRWQDEATLVARKFCVEKLNKKSKLYINFWAEKKQRPDVSYQASHQAALEWIQSKKELAETKRSNIMQKMERGASHTPTQEITGTYSENRIMSFLKEQNNIAGICLLVDEGCQFFNAFEELSRVSEKSYTSSWQELNERVKKLRGEIAQKITAFKTSVNSGESRELALLNEVDQMLDNLVSSSSQKDLQSKIDQKIMRDIQSRLDPLKSLLKDAQIFRSYISPIKDSNIEKEKLTFYKIRITLLQINREKLVHEWKYTTSDKAAINKIREKLIAYIDEEMDYVYQYYIMKIAQNLQAETISQEKLLEYYLKTLLARLDLTVTKMIIMLQHREEDKGYTPCLEFKKILEEDEKKNVILDFNAILRFADFKKTSIYVQLMTALNQDIQIQTDIVDEKIIPLAFVENLKSQMGGEYLITTVTTSAIVIENKFKLIKQLCAKPFLPKDKETKNQYILRQHAYRKNKYEARQEIETSENAIIPIYYKKDKMQKATHDLTVSNSALYIKNISLFFPVAAAYLIHQMAMPRIVSFCSQRLSITKSTNIWLILSIAHVCLQTAFMAHARMESQRK